MKLSEYHPRPDERLLLVRDNGKLFAVRIRRRRHPVLASTHGERSEPLGPGPAAKIAGPVAPPGDPSAKIFYDPQIDREIGYEIGMMIGDLIRDAAGFAWAAGSRAMASLTTPASSPEPPQALPVSVVAPSPPRAPDDAGAAQDRDNRTDTVFQSLRGPIIGSQSPVLPSADP